MTPQIILDIDLTQFTDEIAGNVETAMVRAINRGMDKTRTAAAKAVLQQVAFPASYLQPSQGRLTVSQYASKDRLQATISGRDRATSLRQFAPGAMPGAVAKRGIGVSVAAGGRKKFIKRAFVMKLRNGNLGLAVRSAPGKQPEGAWKPKPIGKNLWLLYGPSVDQVLMSARSGGGVFSEIEYETLDVIETEFQRQLGLLEDGK